jgi:Ca-activated chloride channel family protein
VAETAAADYRQEAATAAAAAGQGGDDEAPAQGAGTDGRLAGHGLVETPEEREARQAADQWLRRIPDDPAELLRRKFLYQYRLRRDDPEALASGEPW